MKLPWFFLVAVTLLAFVGCGSDKRVEPDRYPVTGTVTLDGKPLKKGDISFESEDDATSGLGSEGTEIIDGKFELEARPGKKTIRISAIEEVGEADETGLKETKETIPAKYNDESTLEEEVKAEGENNFTFKLESK